MRVIGHRGASAEAAENTPEAFRLADEIGADGVELDVRPAPDGRLFVAHDPLPDPLPSPPPPTFADALRACGDRMLVNVEIKNSPGEPGYDPALSIVESTIDELRRWGPVHHERWLISSFSWETVQECRRRAPDIPTAFLCTDVDEGTIVRTAREGHCAIHPWVGSLTPALVQECHGAGLIVNTWTCNDEARVRELDEMGVDGVCTDMPREVMRWLRRDGESIDPDPRWGRRGE